MGGNKADNTKSNPLNIRLRVVFANVNPAWKFTELPDFSLHWKP